MTKRLRIAQLVLAAGAGLAWLALMHYKVQWYETGTFLGHYSPKLAVLMALVAGSGGLALLGLGLSFTTLWTRIETGLDRLAEKCQRLGWLLPGLAALLWLLVPLVLLSAPTNTLLFEGLYPRLWTVWLLSLIQVFLWRAWQRRWDPLAILCGALLGYGLAFQLLNYRKDLATTQFSLGWSEASRYYNASLWFSRQIYATWLPLPELHPSRYLLQSLAFLIPDAPIAFHRAWQVFLGIACNGLVAWALARRLWRGKQEPLPRPSPQGKGAEPLPRPLPSREGGQGENQFLLKTPQKSAFPFLTPPPSLQGKGAGGIGSFLLFALWAFLTFFQGPIYYHLILCTLPVLLFFDRKRFWRSLLVVALASVWAGISRVNWYPVPGALAVTLYLLEEPLGGRRLWRYLLPGAVWAGVGIGMAYLANLIYVRLSGNPPQVFGSAFTSDLLWYRLKPNATYEPGVLLASLIFLPVVLAMAWGVLRSGRRWHWLRWLGLLGILGAFYAADVIVSLKVGGGGDLHNFDSFIVLLVVMAGAIFFNQFTGDREGAPIRIPRWALLVLVAIPVYTMSANLVVQNRPAPQMSETEALQWLQGMIDRYASDERPVLFITARQLVTFKQIKVKSFAPAYEKVFLQEMAMARNTYYLDQYLDDLRNRRFSLIISEPMNANYQSDRGFAEENNLFVSGVEEPTLQRYELVGKLEEDAYRLAVYAPKPK
jgi:hypothetical protein